ncbi:MAG: endonuclease/exonuclease/phosphatase family protein [Cytophagaceae bacterium]|nr:endonuclease/exonuclease/phosphatase family protein [Cytophagaceae bacterium]
MLLKIVSIFLGVFCIGATIIAIFDNEAWWIRIFDFPRIQLICISISGIILYLVAGAGKREEKIFLMAVSIAIIFQASKVIPYTRINKKEVKDAPDGKNDERNISILIANVFMDNKRANECLQVIQKNNPDIVLALETNQWWLDQLKVIEKDYPYTIKVPLENTYGMLLFSRLRLIDPQIRYLITNDIPSVKSMVELKTGHRIILYGVHPKPPAPGESKYTKDRDAELVMVGKEARKDTLPVIVCGDLNDVAWSHTTRLFQKVSGLLDPRRGRGMYSTYNANHFFMRWPLDHVFHSTEFRLVDIERQDYIGSDHFPIWVKLKYLPELKHEQKGLKVDQEDMREAKRKIEKVKKGN